MRVHSWVRIDSRAHSVTLLSLTPFLWCTHFFSSTKHQWWPIHLFFLLLPLILALPLHLSIHVSNVFRVVLYCLDLLQALSSTDHVVVPSLGMNLSLLYITPTCHLGALLYCCLTKKVKVCLTLQLLSVVWGFYCVSDYTDASRPVEWGVGDLGLERETVYFAHVDIDHFKQLLDALHLVFESYFRLLIDVS